MKSSLIYSVALMLVLAAWGFSQSSPSQNPAAAAKNEQERKNNGPGKELSRGGKDIGKGAAKGSADLAKGTGKGAGDLVAGHPVDAAASTGKGAAGFGKNVGIGAGKGTVKTGKGLGGAFKKLGRKSSKKHSGND